jgi:adenylyl cyclase-associated protein
MTHKNPELRQSSVVRSSSTSSQSSGNGKSRPPIPKKPNSLSLKPKPQPVVELQDNKWIVKNVENKHDIVIEGEISQSLFIADSKDATIQVKGKINAISLSSTTKVALVLDAAISGISVINSKKFGIQIVEKVPQISIDKSDEGQIYLSKTSLETEIYTTSTTSLNVNIPDDEELDGDFKEVNIPEQFKFTFNNGKLVSEVVEHAG